MNTYPNVAVVGMHFRGSDAVQLAASLEPPTALRLQREPENEWDANAIKVFYEDTWIGYVERGQAMWISMDLDTGSTAVARVTGNEVRGKNIHPILTIYTLTAGEAAPELEPAP